MGSNATLKASMTLDKTKFEQGLTGAISSAKSAGVKMGSVVASGIGGGLRMLGTAGLATSLAGVGSAALGMGKALGKAAEMEGMQVQFGTLLKSSDKAKQRLEELAKFAAETPFELPEIVQASKMLEVLAGSALSTGKGLTLVGDVAAGTGVAFNEVAMWVGRLYDGLQSGRPVGEAMARLQEMGAVSGKLRNEIEKLSESGNGGAAWAAAERGLKRFSGGMLDLSGTFNGMISTFWDGISARARDIGTPVMESLKPALLSVISVIETFKPAADEFGATIGGGIKTGLDLFKNGKLGDYLKLEFEGASLALGKRLTDNASNFGNTLNGKLAETITGFGKGLADLATGFGLLLASGVMKGMSENSFFGDTGKQMKEASNKMFAESAKYWEGSKNPLQYFDPYVLSASLMRGVGSVMDPLSGQAGYAKSAGSDLVFKGTGQLADALKNGAGYVYDSVTSVGVSLDELEKNVRTAYENLNAAKENPLLALSNQDAYDKAVINATNELISAQKRLASTKAEMESNKFNASITENEKAKSDLIQSIRTNSQAAKIIPKSKDGNMGFAEFNAMRDEAVQIDEYGRRSIKFAGKSKSAKIKPRGIEWEREFNEATGKTEWKFVGQRPGEKNKTTEDAKLTKSIVDQLSDIKKVLMGGK